MINVSSCALKRLFVFVFVMILRFVAPVSSFSARLHNRGNPVSRRRAMQWQTHSFLSRSFQNTRLYGTDDGLTVSGKVKLIEAGVEKVTSTALELVNSRQKTFTSSSGSSGSPSAQSIADVNLDDLVDIIRNEERSLECEIGSMNEMGEQGDKATLQALSRVQEFRYTLESWEGCVEDCLTAVEMCGEDGAEAMLDECLERLQEQEEEGRQLKILASFTGAYDDSPSCRFSITAGAGGTEACDWVEVRAKEGGHPAHARFSVIAARNSEDLVKF